MLRPVPMVVVSRRNHSALALLRTGRFLFFVLLLCFSAPRAAVHCLGMAAWASASSSGAMDWRGMGEEGAVG